jgi:F-type H+-transporting ATPase subunit c
MGYFIALAIVVGMGLPVAVLSAAISQGKAAVAALEGIARQPEAAGKIRANMIIGLALIESLVLYALVMFFMLSTRLPETEKMLKLIGGQ